MIKYSITPKKVGSSKMQYYPTVQSEKINADDFAELATSVSIMTKATFAHAMMLLKDAVVQALTSGYSVPLGGMGTLHVTLDGQGADSPDDFTTNRNIKGINIRFRPNTKFMDEVKRKTTFGLTQSKKQQKELLRIRALAAFDTLKII